ncbi:MAG TPA: VWD domain-containing protein [Polyangiaceae bacterium]|nr:VWD domain-containing protein [Polyangiaceae bacterium]
MISLGLLRTMGSGVRRGREQRGRKRRPGALRKVASQLLLAGACALTAESSAFAYSGSATGMTCGSCVHALDIGAQQQCQSFPGSTVCRVRQDPYVVLQGICNCSMSFGCCDSHGVVVGDPHFRTLDGLLYEFQAAGEFILLEAPAIRVQVRTERWKMAQVSVVTALSVRVGDERIAIYADRPTPVRVNGEARALSEQGQSLALASGVVLSHLGSEYFIRTPTGEALTIEHKGTFLNVSVDLQDPSGVVGLLGNGDSDPGNDLQSRGGQVFAHALSFESFYSEFADTWRVAPQESLFDYEASETPASFDVRGFPTRKTSIEDLDATTRAWATQVCVEAGAKDPDWLEACALDVGLSGNADLAPSFRGGPPVARKVVLEGEATLNVGGAANKAVAGEDTGRSAELSGRGGCSMGRRAAPFPQSATVAGLLATLAVALRRARRRGTTGQAS